MEIFVDGGVFELLMAMLFGYGINYIFKRKALLVVFSVIVMAAPVLVLFLKRGELFYMVSFISIANAILLIVLLWKQRTQSAHSTLFNIEKYKQLFFHKFSRKPVS